MRHFALVFVFVVVAGCSSADDGAEPAASAAELFEGCASTHDVRVSPELGEPWRAAFEGAFAAWDPAMARAFPRRVVIALASGDDPCSLAVVPAARPGGADHFAVYERRTISVDDGAVGDDPTFRLALATHEVGHVFGLGHARTFDSVMWHVIQPGVLPSCVDLDGARALWNEPAEFCAPIMRTRRKETFRR